MAYEEFAAIYDELINEDINYEKIYNKIKEICHTYNIDNNDYLDLACGTGNVSCIVGKNFKNTYAVDLSHDMLSIAYEKLHSKKIKSKVICQDMTELNLNHTFDLITCVLDSSNYIIDEEDFENYIKGVYNHLKENGLFVFDMNSWYKLSEILGNNIFTYDSPKVFYTWENIFEDEVSNMFLTFFVKNKNNLYERFDEEHYERAYRDEYVSQVLYKNNFEILHKFDGYSNKPVNEESERILYVVRKRK